MSTSNLMGSTDCANMREYIYEVRFHCDMLPNFSSSSDFTYNYVSIFPTNTDNYSCPYPMTGTAILVTSTASLVTSTFAAVFLGVLLTLVLYTS